MYEKECNFKTNETCNIFDSYEGLSPSKKLELVITIFQRKWLKWTLNGIFGSLGIIFTLGIANYYLSNFDKSLDFKIFGALQIWVGFALGIIATLFSIISMFLSFYNLELQREEEKNSKESLNELKGLIVNEVKVNVNNELELIRDDMLKHFNTLEKYAEDTKQEISKSTKQNLTEGDDNFADLFD